MAFTRVCLASEIPPGQAKCVEVAGRKVAIFNCAGRFLAIDDTCTHEDASLSEGTLCQENGRCRVECPWHGSQFDLETGAVLGLPAVKPVRPYPVRIQGDSIEVGV